LGRLGKVSGLGTRKYKHCHRKLENTKITTVTADKPSGNRAPRVLHFILTRNDHRQD